MLFRKAAQERCRERLPEIDLHQFSNRWIMRRYYAAIPIISEPAGFGFVIPGEWRLIKPECQ